jgi:hypothetical protein
MVADPGALSGVLISAASPPSGTISSAGARAATNPVTAALDANFNAIETNVQADDQRVRRQVAATGTSSARRPSFRSTIRSIEINGRRINVPNAPGPNRQ